MKASLKAQARLAKRQAAYDAALSTHSVAGKKVAGRDPAAFHRPGSLKK